MRKIPVLVVVLAVVLLAPVLYAAAPADQYTVATDTVKDNKTNLTWQRAVPAASYNWADAKTYCANLSLAGYATGWRLPTKREMETLVDRRVASPGPTIDTTAFPGTPNTWFWTSTPLAGYSAYAWYVNFDNGGSHPYDVTGTDRVRCVR